MAGMCIRNPCGGRNPFCGDEKEKGLLSVEDCAATGATCVEIKKERSRRRGSINPPGEL
jgi:hypothetical protein